MKIICIANNYRDIALKSNLSELSKPVFFLKPDSAILRNNQPFFIPDFSEEIEYGVELVIKITRLGKGIHQKFATKYYETIGIGIGFTARDLQRECVKNGLPWEISKVFDNSAALSPIFLPVSSFSDKNNINFRLEINNKLVQEENSEQMVFSFDQTIAYVSKFMTLRTGDLFFMGTPSGTGQVKIGDRLKAYIENQLLLDFFVK
jgi:2-keto-4-pentenoate hydratase/2-oxohepta-3-ene-1,7-dioic acid hydratase in catechol pathway